MTTVFVLHVRISTLPRRLSGDWICLIVVSWRTLPGHRALPCETPMSFQGLVVLWFCWTVSYRRYTTSKKYSYVPPHEHRMPGRSSNWLLNTRLGNHRLICCLSSWRSGQSMPTCPSWALSDQIGKRHGLLNLTLIYQSSRRSFEESRMCLGYLGR